MSYRRYGASVLTPQVQRPDFEEIANKQLNDNHITQAIHSIRGMESFPHLAQPVESRYQDDTTTADRQGSVETYRSNFPTGHPHKVIAMSSGHQYEYNDTAV